LPEGQRQGPNSYKVHQFGTHSGPSDAKHLYSWLKDTNYWPSTDNWSASAPCISSSVGHTFSYRGVRVIDENPENQHQMMGQPEQLVQGSIGAACPCQKTSDDAERICQANCWIKGWWM